MLNVFYKLGLLHGLLGALMVLGRPLEYTPSDIVQNRGCATIITERDRIETESALNEVRRSAGDVLFQDLETRDGQAGPHEAVNATVVAGARVLRRVAFDVHWHVLYANETYEGGYVPDYQIMQQMEVLNRDYKSTNISWNFVNITRIHNPDWFVNAWPGSPQEAEMKKTYHKGNSSTLNIFTAGFNATDKSLGYASLPSAYFREPLKDGLIIRYSTLPGGSHKNYNLGRTTVHELGHWLGLYHTFEGGCTGVGDNVDDTPPESSGAEGCPVGRKSCPDSKDPDPIHNFMDYSFDSCMTHFTPGQAVRMHEAIWAFRTPRTPPPGTSGNHSTIASATSTTSSAAASNSSSATTSATSPAPTTRASSGSSLSSSSSTSATPTTPTSAPTSSITATAEASTTETDENEEAVEPDSADDAESRLTDFSSSGVHQREEDWDEEYERDDDDDDE